MTDNSREPFAWYLGELEQHRQLRRVLSDSAQERIQKDTEDAVIYFLERMEDGESLSRFFDYFKRHIAGKYFTDAQINNRATFIGAIWETLVPLTKAKIAHPDVATAPKEGELLGLLRVARWHTKGAYPVGDDGLWKTAGIERCMWERHFESTLIRPEKKISDAALKERILATARRMQDEEDGFTLAKLLERSFVRGSHFTQDAVRDILREAGILSYPSGRQPPAPALGEPAFA